VFYPPPGYPLKAPPTRTWWTHGRLGAGHVDWEPKPIGPYQGGIDSSFASTSERGVAIPMWSIVLISAVPPAAALRRSLGGVHRGRAGRCGACGYDLRATPDRCPECGATPSLKSRADAGSLTA
jgi:hypothetical protein